MGGHFYWYVVDYQSDIDAALQQLREREFKAGRYSPVISFLSFPVGPQSAAPGPRHRSIREAITASGEGGTRSILDLERITSRAEYSAASPLPEALLRELYGTTTPTREMVEPDLAFSEYMDERGQGIYIVLHRDGRPHEILFAGYSFD